VIWFAPFYALADEEPEPRASRPRPKPKSQPAPHETTEDDKASADRRDVKKHPLPEPRASRR
jgi:hypothetical protein